MECLTILNKSLKFETLQKASKSIKIRQVIESPFKIFFPFRLSRFRDKTQSQIIPTSSPFHPNHLPKIKVHITQIINPVEDIMTNESYSAKETWLIIVISVIYKTIKPDRAKVTFSQIKKFIEKCYLLIYLNS